MGLFLWACFSLTLGQQALSLYLQGIFPECHTLCMNGWQASDGSTPSLGITWCDGLSGWWAPSRRGRESPACRSSQVLLLTAVVTTGSLYRLSTPPVPDSLATGCKFATCPCWLSAPCPHRTHSPHTVGALAPHASC